MAKVKQDQRILHEKESHDSAFQNQIRENVGKYYSIVQISNSFYKEVLFSDCSGMKILELGCGPGNYCIQLAQKGAVVTGIDISDVAIRQAIRQAQEKCTEEKQVQFFVMNAEALRFPDRSFDRVCGISILHHLNLSQIYSETRRVLKPGGKAVFIEPLGHTC